MSELIIKPQMETARLVTPEYRDAILKVRDTIAAVPALRDEEWSSLTKHVTELYVLERFGYLRCCSGDSVIDGIIPNEGEVDIPFDAKDDVFLFARGIQVKGSRKGKYGFGTTGDVKLSSPFKYLYIVWIDFAYRVIESEVYRMEYLGVKDLIEQRIRDKPAGKNNRKLSRADAQRLGLRVDPAPPPRLEDSPLPPPQSHAPDASDAAGSP